MGWTEGNYAPFLNDPSPTHYDISNAQIFIQKTTGWLQFYLQGGAYNIPALGTAFVKTKDTIQGLYGPFPQGYVKLVKGNLNVEVGALPTLIGAEYTFDFENMNIERGLLWNQENAVNRGIQVNDTYKKLSLSFSWNDGFYSSHYNWLTGSAAWAFNASNTLTFVGGGNFNGNGRGLVSASSPATPGLQNNSMIYNLIYTYAHGNWIVTPYYQYTDVKTNATIGIPQGAHTNGGALLVNYNFKHGFSLAARPEYIKSSGSNTSTAANLLGYGPGTGGFSFTATPMWAKDGFFLRADVSVVHITNFNTATGTGFGPTGIQLNQPRGVLEAGFMF
jgi:Putative beta-barrel porin-2, OmpL-like. bbp2